MEKVTETQDRDGESGRDGMCDSGELSDQNCETEVVKVIQIFRTETEMDK